MKTYTPGQEDSEQVAKLRKCADFGHRKESVHDYPHPLMAQFADMRAAQQALGSLFRQLDALYEENCRLTDHANQIRIRARDALEEVAQVALSAEKKYRLEA